MNTSPKPMNALFRFVAAFAALLAVACLAPAAGARVTVDITKGTVSPLPIAITPLQAQGGAEQQVGNDISDIVTNDLRNSGLFRPIDPAAFIQAAQAAADQPRFADWKVLNAQALVTGTLSVEPDGRLKAAFRLWDVFEQSQLAGMEYRFPNQNQSIRQIAHMIADVVYKQLTGEDGYFNTQIVYIAETGPLDRRVKRLAIMDQDGYNNRILSDQPSTLELTPRFSPVAPEITFMAFVGNRPRVYIRNIESGRQEPLGDFPGMSFAPRFAPDGNRVIFSQVTGGDTEIYVMDTRTRSLSQLTNTPGINTAPCYSPDGSKIVFESDRGGSEQLYVMGAGGGAPQRISFGEGNYDGPVWSPRGDLIAFTKRQGGQFFIGIMKPDGSGERLITQGHHVEGPTWAPNGRVLMFFKQEWSGTSSRSRLYSIDITGQNEREIATPTDASDPAWSPPLNP
ncbi:MAG TPA: Tol-Pal system beta propeller repeat protein TolB [Alphaproteobacteria bacterium]|nr:Tol-Pal system beta propeller repeat protein TolB [Alphaproteobacteria bacterium]